MSIHPVLWCLRVPCHVAPELVESVVARLHRLGEFAGAWRTQCRPTCVRAPSRRCLNHADAQLFELGCEAFRLHHVFAQMTPPTTGRGIQTRSILPAWSAVIRQRSRCRRTLACSYMSARRARRCCGLCPAIAASSAATVRSSARPSSNRAPVAGHQTDVGPNFKQIQADTGRPAHAPDPRPTATVRTAESLLSF